MADPIKDLGVNAGVSAEQFNRLLIAMEKNANAASKIEAGFGKFAATMGNVTGTIKSLAKVVGVDLSFSKLITETATYNKSLFDLGNSAKFTTQSYAELKKAADEIAKSTHMTMQESVAFAKTLQSQRAGLKLNATEITNVAKAMDIAHASTEEITAATKSLLEIQSKDINVFKKLSEGMDDRRAIQYARSLVELQGVSEDAAHEFILLNQASRDGNKANDEQQKKNRQLADSIRDLKKMGEDLLRTWGTPLAEAFAKINDKLKDFVGWLKDLPPWVIKLGAAGALGAAAVGVIGKATSVLGIGGGGGGPGGKTGVLGTVANAIGIGAKPDGSSSARALWVRDASGGGMGGKDGIKNLLGGGGGLIATITEAIGGTGATTGALGGSTTAAGLAGPILAGAIAIAGTYMASKELERSDKEANHQTNLTYNTQLEAKKKLAADPNAAKGDQKLETDVLVLKKQLHNAIVNAGGKMTDAAKNIEAKLNEAQNKFNSSLQADLERKNGKAAAAPVGATGPNMATGADVSGPTAITEQTAKNTDLLVKQEEEYATIKGTVENLARANEAILGPQQKQLDYLAKYTQNIEEAKKLNEDIINRLQKEVEERKKLVTQIELEAKSQGDPDGNLAKRRAEAVAGIAERQGQIADQQMRAPKLLDESVSIREQELGLLESEMNLQKSLYAGLGPQLDTLSKMNDKLEETKVYYAEQLRIAKEKLATDKNNPALIKQALEYQQKLTAASQKQVDLTKNLREGYLDAMGAFTNVSGSMAKIITTQQQGLGEMLRTSGQGGSLRGGGIGGGFSNPYARFKQGGGLETTGRDQLDTLMKARGLDKIGKPMVSAMSATGGMPASQQDTVTTNGGKTGLVGAAGSTTGGSAPSIAAVAGGSGGGGNVSGPQAASDPLVLLNQNMSHYVAEGIKMAGGGGMGAGTGTGGKPAAAAPVGAAGTQGAAGAQGAGGNVVAAAQGAPQPAAAGGGGGVAGMAPVENVMKTKIDAANAELKQIQQNIDKNPMKFKSNVAIGNLAMNPAGPAVGGSLGGNEKKRADLEKKISGLDTSIMNRKQAIANSEAGFSKIQRDNDLIDKTKGQVLTNGSEPMKRSVSDEQRQGLERDKQELSGVERERAEAKKKLDALSKGKGQKVMLDDETKKVLKDTANSNKSMEKLQKESSSKLNSGGGSLGMDMGKDPANMLGINAAGFGGSGPLGLSMGNKPTDFGLGAALGMGSGDSFGAGMFGMAEGGKVPGTGTGDTEPALLTPGETVIPKGPSKAFAPILNAMIHKKYALGGVVGPAPSGAMLGGGGSPSISLSVRGDSVDKIMKSVNNQLSSQLNRMMAPHGTTGRQFELSQ